MVTIALCNKDTQPSQACSEGYTFSATALYRGVSLFLRSINWTKLDYKRQHSMPLFHAFFVPFNNSPRLLRETRQLPMHSQNFWRVRVVSSL